MPQIPRYDQQTSVSGAGTGVARPRRGNLASVAAAGAEAFDAVRRRDEASHVQRALADLRLRSVQRYTEAQGNAADDATDFTPGVLKQFDEDLEEAKKAAPSHRAREALSIAALDLRTDLGQRALGFEASRKAAARVSGARTAIDNVRATLELDPDQFESAIAEQSMAIEELGLEPAQRQELREYLATQGFEGAAIGVAKQDPALALKNLATTSSGDKRFDTLTAEQRRKIETFAKGQLAETTAQGILEKYRTDARAGTAALVELSKSDLPADVLDEVRRQVRSGQGLLHAERREQFGEQVTALERSISQGTPGANAEAQAASLYRRGAYSSEQYTNVLQAIDTARQQSAKNGAAAAAVQEAIATGARLDPRDTKVVDAVDAWFLQTTKSAGILPGTDDWVNGAAGIAARTNILPPEAMSWARKTILSGEPKLAVPAANAMARWADAAPAAYAYFDDPLLKANAESIDGMVRAGVAPAKAVELARAQTYDIPKARLDAIAADYGKQKYAADNASELKSFMDSDDSFDRRVFGGAPEPSLAMQDEYSAQVRRYFDLTNGDIGRARELAWKDIRGTYGISTVNGSPQVMKWAPELVYPGIDPAVIRSDVDAVGKSLGITAPLSITPDRVTGDTQGLRWKLTYVNEDGDTEVVLDERNRPRYYEIPTDTKVYVAAQENAKRAAVESAREKSRKAREMAEAMAELGAYPGY
jgi:hypothetical protein